MLSQAILTSQEVILAIFHTVELHIGGIQKLRRQEGGGWVVIQMSTPLR